MCVRSVEYNVVDAWQQWTEAVSDVVRAEHCSVEVGDELRRQLTLSIVPIHRQHDRRSCYTMLVGTDVQFFQQILSVKHREDAC